MARPRKNTDNQEVRDRLIEAMIHHLVYEPAAAVTVASLIKEVGCNRSTFYYHFADTNELVETALVAVTPTEIPLGILTLVSNNLTGNNAQAPGQSFPISAMAYETQQKSAHIDVLCRLLNGPNAPLVQTQIKRYLFDDLFANMPDNLSIEKDDPRTRILFEYTTGGIMALMAYRAATGFTYTVDEIIQCLCPEIPNAIYAALTK